MIVRKLTLHGTMICAAVAQIALCFTFALPAVHTRLEATIAFLPLLYVSNQMQTSPNQVGRL